MSRKVFPPESRLGIPNDFDSSGCPDYKPSVDDASV
jgi:hypothetical protein